MNYLTVAEQIFHWLALYQVNPYQIVAKRRKDKIHFDLDHPIEGRVNVIEPLPREEFFRSHGVGLKMIGQDDEWVRLDVYDHGGIFDPVDYSVPGDHYATTHFAMLGAILYRELNDESILRKVKQAIRFHLRTAKDEYHFGEWGYHWDFQNYAFLETYRLLKDVLLETENKVWMDGLMRWHENRRNSLTNWIAMRAYSSLLKYRLLGISMDKIRFLWRLRAVDRARHPDGCYDDAFQQSRPIQYHVYTLALLHRIYLLRQNKDVKKKFLAGVHYFTQFIDPDGCFNYLGRGQEQIFGYAVGLYVLEAAKQLDEMNARLYQSYRDRVWNYLVGFFRDGHFPLVLNSREDAEKCGWYDYHHLTVYNAFLGAWLALTHSLKTSAVSGEKKQDGTPRFYFQYFESTKNIIISKDAYFVTLSGGNREYFSEPGLTPIHVWFKNVGWVFSCPGGPSPMRYGKINVAQNVEKNFFCPIAHIDGMAWFLPAHRECRIIRADPDQVIMALDYGPFNLNRIVTFDQKAIVFKDTFQFKEDINIEELRYFNFPVVVDKFKIEINRAGEVRLVSNKGMVCVVLINTDFTEKCFEKIEQIKTAKGLACVVALREHRFRVKAGQKNSITFSLSSD